MTNLNPTQEFDEKTRRRNKIIRVVIALLLMLVLLKVFAYDTTEKSKLLLPGDAKLSSSMSFEEADRKMQEAGFVPFTEVFEDADGSFRWYKGVDIYGYTPYFSAIGIADSTKHWSQIVHFFQEPESADMKNPGKIITDIKEKLTESIGIAPIWNSEAECWEWEPKYGFKVILYYSVPNDMAALTYGYV